MALMANDRLKRRLLAELVQENVDLIEGGPVRRVKRQARARLAMRLAALALLPVGLLGSSRLLSNLADRPAGPGAAGPPSAVAALGAVRPVRAPVLARLAAAGSPAAVPLKLPEARPISASLFPLAVRKIMIDPGHGGPSVGTRTMTGLIEKNLTLDIASRLRDILASRYSVLMTREEDRAVDLADRAALANRAGADIFVSIHLNWIEDRKARGVETYYLGPTDDPYLTQLAAAENRDSGYSLADLRRILDGIYAGVREDNSQRLARSVQASLYRALHKAAPEVTDRGVKAAPFIVLLSTEMPAILAEVSCLSNEEEARQLNRPEYRQHSAEALAEGIGAYALSTARSGEKGI
ncbi:MAG TPA: N-acetylmuramoyl-L-alanine amidase [Thermoanaerobaculia bacterium]|nr:N-acetylmuramoyl-L-alanine amidase [Thermoanaerobaculia bacterium]